MSSDSMSRSILSMHTGAPSPLKHSWDFVGKTSTSGLQRWGQPKERSHEADIQAPSKMILLLLLSSLFRLLATF